MKDVDWFNHDLILSEVSEKSVLSFQKLLLCLCNY